jgi:hypothetical protein
MISIPAFVMSNDNGTLHPIYRGEAAILRACPEQAENQMGDICHFDWISVFRLEIFRDSSRYGRNDKK